MSDNFPELNQRILEMAEGDEEFRLELTSAIYQGLLELEVKYSEGFQNKDEVKIQQIRHKIKPTLAMFDFNLLTDSMQKGKAILESEGFGDSFESHYHEFIEQVKAAAKEVNRLNN